MMRKKLKEQELRGNINVAEFIND
jgi:hypothetical protein